MATDWTIEEGDAGCGKVIHTAAPRFTALWASGADDLAAIEGPCWTCEGSDAEDSLHVFGFVWIDPAPEQAEFERLMQCAAAAIDEWIAGQM